MPDPKYKPVSDFYKNKKKKLEKSETNDERKLNLLIKETDNANKDEEEFLNTLQIKNPKSIKYENQKKELEKKKTYLTEDNRTDFVKKIDQNKGEFEIAKKEALKRADVVTDVAQLGNFIPHPAFQAIGKVGNVIGTVVDGYQAYNDFSKGDYVNGTINTASAILPNYLDTKSFGRNSKYSPISKELNSIFGDFGRTKYLNTLNQVRNQSSQQLDINRALLGSLGAETWYDAVPTEFQQGGYINQNNNMNRYAQGGDLTQFNEGGTHEQSPIGGVPIGNNNSVEQGETKQNNFIYSDRIFLDSNIVSQYNLPKSLIGKSVADATKLIDNKFKGRNDKISQSTKNSMLSKIAEAQEAMKPQEPEPQMDPNMIEQSMDQNQMFLGGDLDETKLEPYMGSIKQGTGAISSILSGDRDGAVNGVIGGGLSAAGTAIGGPIGGMIGSALAAPISGAINGLLNKGKLEQERKDQHVRDVSKNVNDFALGGVLPKPLIADDLVKPTTKEQIQAYQLSKGIAKPGVEGYGNFGPKTTAQFELDKKNWTPETPDTSMLKPQEQPFVEPTGVQAGMEAYYQKNYPQNNKTYPKANLSKLGDTLGQAARYAPIAMNAYQLSQLKKADVESLNRLDKRYTPEYVDEKQLQNIANSELNNVSNSLTSATNGSIGDLRNNLLGASLNRGKTLSNAYMDANNQNRATNDKAQLFNAEQDIRNQQIDTQEKDINSRNQAAYRNEKSKYLSEIGNGIGDIGKEEVYKGIAKNTTGYNFDGTYVKSPDGNIVTDPYTGKPMTQEKLKELQKKPMSLGGYLIKNKK